VTGPEEDDGKLGGTNKKYFQKVNLLKIENSFNVQQKQFHLAE